MVDSEVVLHAENIGFASDASANRNLGIGATFGNKWLFSQWETGYIDKYNPRIEYLELYTVTAALLTWGQEQELQKTRIVIRCGNAAVVDMINTSSSSC